MIIKIAEEPQMVRKVPGSVVNSTVVFLLFEV